ncbi:MAG: hypothetical protein MZU97_27205 [Bacillus subtilis]|nr:hypothetical protein [Bacillus subtilis]
MKKAAEILGIKILEGKAADAAKAEARKNAQKAPKPGPRYDAPELARFPRPCRMQHRLPRHLSRYLPQKHRRPLRQGPRSRRTSRCPTTRS